MYVVTFLIVHTNIMISLLALREKEGQGEKKKLSFFVNVKRKKHAPHCSGVEGDNVPLCCQSQLASHI